MSEEWRVIPEFPDYMVSNQGRICRVLSPTIKTYKGRPSAAKVSLRRNNKTHVRSVHRIVLETFVGPPPAGCEGCHGNGDPLDNRVDNLRWDTHPANAADSVRHGTFHLPPKSRGQRPYLGKVLPETRAAILEVRLSGMAIADIAAKFFLSEGHVRKLLRKMGAPRMRIQKAA